MIVSLLIYQRGKENMRYCKTFIIYERHYHCTLIRIQIRIPYLEILAFVHRTSIKYLTKFAKSIRNEYDMQFNCILSIGKLKHQYLNRNSQPATSYRSKSGTIRNAERKIAENRKQNKTY